jgi:hypothetical protein
MTGGGHLWKTGIAHAMGASRRFPTAAHHPWKTLRVSHIPTAPAILFSLFKLKNERPRRARRLTSVQAHLSMRICWSAHEVLRALLLRLVLKASVFLTAAGIAIGAPINFTG